MKHIGLLLGLISIITMVSSFEPVAPVTFTSGTGGAGETSVQQTGGKMNRTSVVISGPKVVAPGCPVFEAENGFCS